MPDGASGENSRGDSQERERRSGSSPSLYRDAAKLPSALVVSARRPGTGTPPRDRRSPMPRKDDVSGRQSGPQGETARSHTTRLARDESAFGLEALARTTDEAALNMSLLAIDGDQEAAGRLTPRDAAEATRRLADQVTGQMKGLERSEEHPSELQSLMRISYAVFCLKKKT